MSAQPSHLEEAVSSSLRPVPDVTEPGPLTELSHTQLRLRIHRLLAEIVELEEELKRRSSGEFTPPRADDQVEAAWRRRTGAHLRDVV